MQIHFITVFTAILKLGLCLCYYLFFTVYQLYRVACTRRNQYLLPYKERHKSMAKQKERHKQKSKRK